MARTTTKTAETEPVTVEATPTKVVETPRLDERVTVHNVAPWTVGFIRLLSVGDVSIPAKGITRLSREEILAQIQSGNKLFNGIDARGSHATIFVDDDYVRQEAEFDLDGETQNILTKDKVKEIFAKKTIKEFKAAVEDCVKTRAEKANLIDAIAELKLNDYEKIRFCEEYTGNKIR